MRKKLKICSPQLGISPNSSLGGEVYDYQTLKGFTIKDFEVFVYLPRDRKYDQSLNNFYVTYSFLKHVVPPWLFSLICLPYLFRTYKKERFDILRIHSPRYLGIAGIIFHLFYPKVPILVSAVSPQESKFLYSVEKKIYGIASRIIVQSAYMKKRLQKSFNVDPKKISITYGGQLDVIAKRGSSPVEAKTIKNNESILLFMGVMNNRKNPAFLVDVLGIIVKSNLSIKLVFIGDGNQKKFVQNKLEYENLANYCIFLESAYREQKSYWLNRMDIFVLPSLEEGFGLSLTEAMSFAKPVIASNIAPFKEIIKNGIDGFTLELDSSVWAKVILDLLRNDGLRKKIGERAKLNVEKYFTWQRTYDLNKKIIRELTK